MSTDIENKKQFLILYERHADELFRYCFFKTGDRELSVELVQEVFTRMWNSLIKGVKPDNFKAFVYTLMRNAITDWYRKKKSMSLDELQENGFDVSNEEDVSNFDKLEIKRLINKISSLKEKHREIIVLRYINDMSISEISKLLNEQENTISVRIHRAVDKLRKIYIKK